MSIAAPAVETHAGDSVTLDDRSGRLREVNLPENERMFALAIHLSPFSFVLFGGVWPVAVVLPLILWLVRKDHSVFNDDHGREVVNFCISFVLFHIILAITIVGLLLIPVLWIVAIVSFIRGAIAASRGEYFRYPVTIRFL